MVQINQYQHNSNSLDLLDTSLFDPKRSSSARQKQKLVRYEPLDKQGNIVPTDPHQFYLWLGPILHPETKQIVPRYTTYQLKGWDIQLDRDLLVVKSNKVGYSTAALDMLIQNCLLKNSAGYEKLIVCQTSQLAKEHLYTIRKRLIESEYGSNFLISQPREYLLKDEVTKVTELFIDNPYNPNDPSRIFGIGASAGSVVSWKRVNYCLASDITKSKTDYRAVLDGLETRLANTQGRMHIETIPNGPQGKIYELYEQILSGDITRDDMDLLIITAQDAVKEGVITQSYLDKAKKRLGVMYAQYFNADFIAGSGNVFLPDDIRACYEQYDDPTINQACSISMGIDPGFGSSKFAITVLQFEDGIFKVLYAREWDRPSYEDMINLIAKLRYQYKPSKIFVDAAKPDIIKSLKIKFGEYINYKEIVQQAKKEKIDSDYRMFVCPVAFNEHGAELLGRFQHIVSKHWFSFSSIEHKELLKQMSSAQFQDNGNLDKAEVGDENTFDVFDSTRLAFKMFEKSDRR